MIMGTERIKLMREAMPAVLRAAAFSSSVAGTMPSIFFWFRWGAVATWLGGAWLLGENFVNAFTFRSGFVVIGIGAWLGTIMLFNVWVLIWPNQKKILGIVAASDEQKAKARKTAGMASRINFVLSIPMLMCMAGQSHGLLFFHSG